MRQPGPRRRRQISKPPRLLLWDIDGTLLTSGGAGEKAIRLAVRDYFDADDDLRNIEIAGRTDTGIARQLLAKYGQTGTAENAAAFLEHYLRHLAIKLPEIQGRLLPGIAELLAALAADERIALGLLTGNLRRGAELKLIHYGLWQYFAFGAFADDSPDRNELGPFALARAGEECGTAIPAEETFVIGDTPHDLACARIFGANAVGVATGNYSLDQLAEHEPDALFPDFSDVESALAYFLPEAD